MREGWIETAQRPAFRGGLRVLLVACGMLAMAFGVLALLAWRAEAGVVLPLAAAAVGYALVALGTRARRRWGRAWGVVWLMTGLITCIAVMAIGVTSVVGAVALVAFALLHAWGAIYLAVGERPNARMSGRRMDPAFAGPWWHAVDPIMARTAPEARIEGGLAVILAAVAWTSALSVARLVDEWEPIGAYGLLEAALSVTRAGVGPLLLLLLLGRAGLAWPLTFLWAADLGLQGIAMALSAPPLVLLAQGIALALASVWAMLYMAHARRPNLRYLKRARVLHPGERL